MYIKKQNLAQTQIDGIHCIVYTFVFMILSDFLLSVPSPIPYSLKRRPQQVTSQFSSQATNENAALQWTGSHNITQGQTQYGYNYHHIDQRTENQSAHLASVDTKPGSQPNTTDVYAEFTTDAAAVQCGSDQVESYYIPGVNAKYSLDDPGSKFKYMAEVQDGDDSNFICTSELQSSQDQADGQRLCESDRVQYQFEGHPNQPNVNHERGDHAQYVPEEYVHFLLERLAFIFGPQ